jgi:hypothetical protein
LVIDKRVRRAPRAHRSVELGAVRASAKAGQQLLRLVDREAVFAATDAIELVA